MKRKSNHRLPEAYQTLMKARKGLGAPADFVHYEGADFTKNSIVSIPKTSQLKKQYGAELAHLLKNQSNSRWGIERLDGQLLSRSAANNFQGWYRTVAKIWDQVSLFQITNAVGDTYNYCIDLTSMDIQDLDLTEETILQEKAPDFIPVINSANLRALRFVPDVIRVGPDKYLFTESYQRNYTVKDYCCFYLMTLDQLVLSIDYYLTYEKAKERERAEQRRRELTIQFDSFDYETRERYYNSKIRFTDLPPNLQKEIGYDKWLKYSLEQRIKAYHPVNTIRVKRVSTRFGAKGSMNGSFHKMYEHFINPQARLIRNRYMNPEVGKYYDAFLDFVKWKLNDVKIARSFDRQTKNKGFETSYGRSGTSDALYFKHHVLIKRQDGSQIRQVEIDDIDNAVQMTLETFGDFRPYLIEDTPVISHANLKHMFARSAIGLFVGRIPAIGISRLGGQTQFYSTAAHEFAHYIDYKVGRKYSGIFMSWNYESTAGLIASVFRASSVGSMESDYLSSAHECFARAMQQYFTMKYFPEENLHYFSFINIDKPTTIDKCTGYCEKEVFKERVEPLIERFISENFSQYKAITRVADTSAAKAQKQRIRILGLKYKYTG